MSAFLYTWNPKRWTWVDHADAVYRVSNGDQYDMYWSCGNTKKIAIGDMFFLMRLGEDPKGIIGCGYVSSLPYELPHWDADKASSGRVALRTDLLFTSLSDGPIIRLEELTKLYPDYNWTPQAGGCSIPGEIASQLLKVTQENPRLRFRPQTLEDIKQYAEGKSRTVTSKTYDRSPRARQACIEHYGYDCVVCGFNFNNLYGGIGSTYVEVHHLRQIADIGEEYLIDPIKDLRPGHALN